MVLSLLFISTICCTMRSICYLRGYAGMGIGVDIDSLDFKDMVVVMPRSSEFCFPFLIMLLMFRLCLAFLSYPPLFIVGGLFSLYSFALSPFYILPTHNFSFFFIYAYVIPSNFFSSSSFHTYPLSRYSIASSVSCSQMLHSYPNF